MAVKPIPDGYHSLTPYIIAGGVAKLIAFLKKAFEATEVFPAMTLPDGTIKHVELKIGDSVVMIAEADGDYKASPCMLYHYVQDIDAVYKRSLEAGGTSICEPKDQFYGDRSAGVKDPSGNQWWIATRKEDVTPEECTRRMRALEQEKVNA